MHRRLLVPGVLATGLLLALPASAADYTPGAPSIGDSYYPAAGNGGYDVSHYDLRLKYQPKTDLLEGTATILATTKQDLSRFNLDFALKVTDVRVNGEKARFKKTGQQELEITPAQGLPKDTPLTVVVRYADKPSTVKINDWTAWVRTPDGAVAAQEPESAAWWFPSNDHPLDKASYDVSVSVPDGTQAISNGTLQSTSSKAGWTRYSWRSPKPQASYLTTLAVGKFDITTGKTSSGLPIVNAYSKDLGENAGAARASIERTGEAAEFLEQYFGPYPFNALGGYVPNVKSGFALETQTRPFYSPKQFAKGSNVSVVVHELAHQWYGDSVSLGAWSDIWLNEGFASYAQWLWSEAQGEGTTQEIADYVYDSYPADDEFWTVKPGDPGPDKQFDGAVYDRGALTVQALRNEVGDKAFFEILKGWPTERAHGNARIPEFVAYAEKVSGKQLDELFDTWLFQPTRPEKSKAKAAGLSLRSGAPIEAPKGWKQIEAVHELHGHGGKCACGKH
ncbi:M1 family metallopeptidase [Streptomyces sp. NA04227]|uniref:M1 family metallopeptidase n=1 Tax=Streptomyces sp. NA04227 TaxID=2742136 RepID=UPI00158FE646|nr:M1 family metallopeptidase [Streptomyces sp. NA04227]QKW10219.1 M1 family metallopeptidase [Streptomyces sp. NA04227]